MCGAQPCTQIFNPPPQPTLAPTPRVTPTPKVTPPPRVTPTPKPPATIRPTPVPPSTGKLRPGDAGVRFDTSKFDPDYPQMREWIKAGVRGGIPLIQDQLKRYTVSLRGGNSASINSAIASVANNGGGVVYLHNGNYDINQAVKLRSNVSIIGESRSGVVATVARTLKKGGAFELIGIRNAGIYQMHIRGAGSPPRYDWNIGSSKNLELPDNENISVFIKDSEDCWVTDTDIINSYDFPVRVSAKHITLRGLNIDGAYNKSGGAHGYFFILNGYNLVTQSKITRIRHISLQGDDVEYNVLYDNDFKQEVSFHSDDDGNNLIENNRIHLPLDMPPATVSGAKPDYRCVMGPWSTKHQNSKRPNYLWNNDCLQDNHGGTRPLSGNNVIYIGPVTAPTKGQAAEDNWRPSRNIPAHGTLYPVILN